MLYRMLCANEIHTPSSLENLEAGLDPQERLRLQNAMVASGAVLKQLRRRKLHRMTK